MLVILPILSFISLLFYFSTLKNDFRKSWAYASLVIFISIALTTEFLSVFELVGKNAIVVFWSTFVLLTLFLFFKNRKRFSLIKLFESSGFNNWWLINFFALLFVLNLLILALIASPNNWDSMTYHLGRIVHWIQNGDINFYPTNIMRQLNFPPFSEIMMMHLFLLSGNDNLMNVVQWFSYISLAITSPLIYDELGGNPKSRTLVSVLAIAIPMAILQASSTQNDLVASYLIILAIWRLILLIKKVSLFNLVTLSISASLAFYTKTVSYIYLLPFFIWLAFEYIKKGDIKKAFMHGLIFAFVVLTINGPQYARNYFLWGNPMGADKKDIHLNSKFTIPYTLSNMIRNYFTQFETANSDIDNRIHKIVNDLHRFIGVKTNDPNTTFEREAYGLPFREQNIYHPDYAPNPLPMAILTIGVIFVFVFERGNKSVFQYTLVGLSSFFLFSMFFRWQPWISRLMVPLFYIFTPISAYVISSISKKMLWVFVTILLILSLPYFYNNSVRPLTGKNSILRQTKEAQYFNGNPSIMSNYFEGIKIIKESGCKKISLNMNPDDYEYPIWALLRKESVKIEHHEVQNITSLYYNRAKFANFEPCAIINTNEWSYMYVDLLN